MENLFLAVNVIAPLLILLAVGMLLKKLNFLPDAVIKAMNRVVALVLLPVLVFKNISQADISGFSQGNVLLFCFLGILAEFFLALLIAKLITKDKKSVA